MKTDIIELLESRIAPATFVNASTVTYTDPDGDLVTVHATKPIFDAAFTGFTFVGNQLERLVLGVNAKGVSLAFTARAQGLVGDGHVDIGAINASGGGGIDLGAILVDGDLGQIDAGDGTAKTPGLKSLTVQTLGGLGLTTQGGVGDLVSTIQGPLGALTVKGDVTDAEVETIGATAKIGAVVIKGSLLGGAVAASGSILAGGDLGKVTISGSLRGGAGDQSGRLETAGKLGNVSIGGSIVGDGTNSGVIATAVQSGKVTIGGDVQGGAGSNSGVLDLRNNAGIAVFGSVIGGAGSSTGQIAFQQTPSVFIHGNVEGGLATSTGRLLGGGGRAAKITVGGSVIGQGYDNCGVIFASDVGNLTIMGDIIGGGVLINASAHNTGAVFANRIDKLFIGGSVIAGRDLSTGSLDRSGAICVDRSIGSLVIGGSLLGNSSHPALISAAGNNVQGKTDLAIKTVSITGHSEFGRIVAGYNYGGVAVDSRAQIGTVTVGGDWIASDITAGIDDGGDGVFGNGNDVKIALPAMPAIASQIAKIIIGGRILGTPGAGDQFAFEAQKIGQIKVGLSSIVPLTMALDDFALSPATGSDVRVREFA